MTAPARHSDNPHLIDRCTGKPFESDEDIDQDEQHCSIKMPTSASKSIHADG
jgi:hypothetical protein